MGYNGVRLGANIELNMSYNNTQLCADMGENDEKLCAIVGYNMHGFVPI